jgi:hypothetical protein
MPRPLRKALDVFTCLLPALYLKLEQPNKQAGQRLSLYGFQLLLCFVGRNSDLKTGKMMNTATMLIAYFMSTSFETN